MTDGATAAAIGPAILLAGYVGAAISDVRTREVTDRLWQVMGAAGLVLGAVLLGGGGAVPLVLWVVVGLLALEHLFAWDDLIPPSWAAQADRIELGGYVAVVVAVAIAAVRYGFGPSGVPAAVIAALATVLISRALFEVGALYGGADAKALMVAGLLVPIYARPLPGLPVLAAALATIPFSINLLTDAALFSLAVPLFLAVRNLRRGEFSLARGFTGYSMAVADLPTKFVWVRDPAVEDPPAAEEPETSAEDEQLRRETARRLTARGIARVWVSPQLPFLVLMTAGAAAAFLAGNLVLDAIALI